MIHIADTGQHVLDEALMAGDVDEAGDPAVRQRHIGKAEVDGEAARPLLRKAVGVDTGESAHQRGLAVVDVSGRRNDHEGSLGAWSRSNAGWAKEACPPRVGPRWARRARARLCPTLHGDSRRLKSTL